MPFAKGQSGNPKGRPPIQGSWSDLVRRIGDEPHPRMVGRTRKQVIVERLFDLAEKSDEVRDVLGAFVGLANREEGSPKQAIDATSNGETIQGYVVVPGKHVEDAEIPASE